MKLKFFLFLLVFSLQYGLAPSYAMELEDLFKEGKQFRRTQAKSPIYLKWTLSSSPETPSEFQIRSFETNDQIGHVRIKLDHKREAVYFSSFVIDDAMLGSEVFRTLSGIFKASKHMLPSEIKYLSHICPRDNQEILDAAMEAGFRETQIYLLNPSQLYLIKEILVQEPALPQSLNNPQAPLPIAKISITPKTILDNVPRPLSTFNISTAFKVGKKYQSKSHEDIYLQYAAEIDVEKVMEVSMKGFGFKIFRTHENNEIGYIVPNYLPTLGDIRIGAIWINEDMRCRGYGSKSLLTLMSLYTSKKAYFPAVKYFSFYSTRGHKAMLKVAQKVGFVEATPQEQQGLMSLFNGIFFKKPFDSKK